MSKFSIIFLDVDGVLSCSRALTFCFEDGDNNFVLCPQETYVLERMLISNLKVLIGYNFVC